MQAERKACGRHSGACNGYPQHTIAMPSVSADFVHVGDSHRTKSVTECRRQASFGGMQYVEFGNTGVGWCHAVHPARQHRLSIGIWASVDAPQGSLDSSIDRALGAKRCWRSCCTRWLCPAGREVGSKCPQLSRITVARREDLQAEDGALPPLRQHRLVIRDYWEGVKCESGTGFRFILVVRFQQKIKSLEPEFWRKAQA
ncbi:hypothetical protein LF1_59400 [Rubripirellula obstinata]|uniref:Uncharacterized protein n=1 Tax=Rubripirellula obstinata TaxID=406547 RepID=A0A5B1CB74_9BACT|nr:hypothetical protein LF1_59400 [Rubripirellula obstinata]